MTVGTVFTLFVVPVFYMLIAAEHRAEAATEEAEPVREVAPRGSLVEA
jgi:hypothetical protein